MSVDSFHTSGHSPGPDFDKPTAVFPTVSRCRVGLLGFGTVGSAVARRLASHAVRGLDLTHIFDRRAHRKRNRLSSGGAGRIVWTDRIDDVLTSDIDVVVEATGGVEPAAGWIRAALLAGCAMEQAVADARARAYAELDPSDDLDGLDAAAKLAILCALGFGLRVDPAQIETRSAARIATADFHDVRRRGGTIRQLAYAEYDHLRSTLTAWVAPAAVPRSSIFAYITGAQNAAIITTVHAGDIGIFGAGAGGDATAVAVMSDLVAIARDRAAIVPAPILSAPRAIVGLEPAKNVLVTTSSAEFADHTENVSVCGLGGLRVDCRLEAEAV